MKHLAFLENWKYKYDADFINNLGYIIALGLVSLYGILNINLPPRDWQAVFAAGANGDFSRVATPFWSLFLSFLPAQIPEPYGYVVWILLNAVILIITVRFFKSPLIPVLLSYQFNWILFYGQIDPLVIFGLPLGLWAIEHKRPIILGMAITLLLIKPQYGLLPGLMLLWWGDNKWKPILVIVAIMLLSFIVWPGWHNHIIHQWLIYRDPSMAMEQHHEQGNTSLHIPIWIGTLVSIISLFVPIVDRQKKLLGLLSVGFIFSPYSTIYSQLAMLVFPIPAFYYVFGFLPWVKAILLGPFNQWEWMAVFPLAVWVYVYLPAIRHYVARLQDGIL